jgi:hypothetical protein
MICISLLVVVTGCGKATKSANSRYCKEVRALVNLRPFDSLDNPYTVQEIDSYVDHLNTVRSLAKGKQLEFWTYAQELLMADESGLNKLHNYDSQMKSIESQCLSNERIVVDGSHHFAGLSTIDKPGVVVN